MITLPGGVGVETLVLDELNPRLPEDVQSTSQVEILKYLFENDVLKELAESFAENHYFENEPLLVLPELEGKRVVVEGNRRLSALMILLQLPTARQAGLDFKLDDLASGTKETLRKIPAVEVRDRDELSSYLGFRHISGLRTWSPDAKARYVHQQVEDAVFKGSKDPFYDIGRRIGSHAGAVRSQYLAYEVVLSARRDFGLEDTARHLLDERFGVWQRVLGTKYVPEYIGLGDASRTYEGVKARVAALDGERLAEVLNDLTPAKGASQPLLFDSRDATLYSEVLANKRAHSTLRAYGNLELAGAIVKVGNIGKRIFNIRQQIEVLASDIGLAESVPADAPDEARQLLYQATLLDAGVKSKAVDGAEVG